MIHSFRSALFFLLISLTVSCSENEVSKTQIDELKSDHEKIDTRNIRAMSFESFIIQSFEHYCFDTLADLDSITDRAQRQRLQPLSKFDLYELPWGIISFETKGWTIEHDRFEIALIAQRGGVPSKNDRERFKRGEAVVGPELNEDSRPAPFSDAVGSTQCSIFFANGDINQIQNLLAALNSDDIISKQFFQTFIREGSGSNLGRNWNSHTYLFQSKDWEHPVTLSYAEDDSRAVIPNREISISTGIRDFQQPN